MNKQDQNNILLIEQDLRKRNDLASRLRYSNFDVLAATGGFHALHLLEKDPCKLIIISSDMDDMSAAEVLSLIRGQWDKNALPILYFGERDQENLSSELIEYVNCALTDASNFNDLLKVINSHMK